MAAARPAFFMPLPASAHRPAKSKSAGSGSPPCRKRNARGCCRSCPRAETSSGRSPLGGASADQIETAIDALDLGHLADRRIDRLSTGERSRVLIARALASEPALLLLDEPTANLDPLWQLRLMDMLRGRTAIVAMHDLDSAAEHADRLIVMDKGRVAADGPPTEVVAGATIAAVFGIEKVEGRWRPLSPPARPQSSP
jgi:iron complex transport system ATP-binding protein